MPSNFSLVPIRKQENLLCKKSWDQHLETAILMTSPSWLSVHLSAVAANKQTYICISNYLCKIINRKHRSYFAWYRCGNISLEDRICKICDNLVVEDEYHFIFHCSLYKNIRDPFLQIIEKRH